jgi:hypothetical protein
MITVASLHIHVNSTDAETGKGADVFKVLMTTFGVENWGDYSVLDLMNWINRISSMSRDELREEGYRLIARVQALDNKEKSIKLACQSRSKLIPKNATIRKEFVK